MASDRTTRKKRTPRKGQPRARAQRLDALQRVSQAVSGTLDLESVSGLALEATMTVLRLDGAAIRYVEEETRDLVLLAEKVTSEELSRELLSQQRLKMGQSLAGRVAQTGEVTVMENLPEDGLSLFPAIVKLGYHSYIGLPLKVKGKVIGVLSGFSVKPRRFASDDIEMLGSLGNMVGMAISNARLFRTVERGHKQWEQTFDAMGDGAAVISADRIVRRANWGLAKMLNTTPWALIGKPCFEAVGCCDVPPEWCPAGISMKKGEAFSVVTQPHAFGGRWVEMRVDPLVDSDGRISGMVHIFRDVTRERQQRNAVERLYKLSRVLTSSLDLGAVLNVALDEFARTFPAEGATAGIALFDQFEQFLHVQVAKGPQREAALRLSLPLAALDPEAQETLFKEKRPLLRAADSAASCRIKSLPGLEECAGFVALPLTVGERITGMLFRVADEPRLPDAEEQAMLETFAREIAMAIENARLYTLTDAALRKRVGELEGLTGVLSAATGGLELSSILGNVLKRAAGALGADRAGMGILDETERKIAVAVDYRGDNGGGLMEAGLNGNLYDSPLVKRMLQELTPVVVENWSSELEGKDKDAVAALGLKSLMIVPLAHTGTAVGYLSFGMEKVRRVFTEAEVSLGQAIAAHLASVVENARLHERTERERGTLESIISSMGEGLLVVDGNGVAVYCNPAAEELLRVDASNFVGQPVDVCYRMLASKIVGPPDWRAILSEGMKKGGGTRKVRLFVQLAELREIEGTIFSIEREDRRLGTGIVLRDVTKEREVDRMKTEFISIASHELRTPLTSIFGYAELLLERSKVLPDKERRWVETIHREGKRLADIIEDMLNVTRIESGRLSLRLESVILGAVVDGLIEQLACASGVDRLKNEVPEDLPAVRADPSKLQQVLHNLADNALKYSPAGGEVAFTAELGVDGQVVLSVSDHGLGIPEDEIPRLFSKFHRVNRLETAGMRGTGLGLYIVKSLMEMMGGRVWVQSRLGQGTTFFISLPVFEHAITVDNGSQSASSTTKIPE